MRGYIGLLVRPVKEFSVDVCLFPGYPLGTRRYTPDDVFVVEHDFRDNGEGDGIHLGCPNGDWMAMTGQRFSEVFGERALQRLEGLIV